MVFYTTQLLCSQLSRPITFCRSQQCLPVECSINFFTPYFLKSPEAILIPLILLHYYLAAFLVASHRDFVELCFFTQPKIGLEEDGAKRSFLEQATNKNESLSLCLILIWIRLEEGLFYCSLREGSISHLRWEIDSCQIFPLDQSLGGAQDDPQGLVCWDQPLSQPCQLWKECHYGVSSVLSPMN